MFSLVIWYVFRGVWCMADACNLRIEFRYDSSEIRVRNSLRFMACVRDEDDIDIDIDIDIGIGIGIGMDIGIGIDIDIDTDIDIDIDI